MAARYNLQEKPKMHLQNKNYAHQRDKKYNANKNKESTAMQQYPKSVVGRFVDSETTLESAVAQFGGSYLNSMKLFIM